MWDGTHWHRYAIVNEVLIPGSVNYTILGGAVLWLIDCGSARADGTWPSPPVPTGRGAEEAGASGGQVAGGCMSRTR